VVQLGDTLLRIVQARGSDAAVERGAPGSRTFVRAPRLLPSDRQVTVTLPQEPAEREARRFPVVMIVAPMLIGIVMAAVLRQPLYLIFAIASPVMMVSNVVSERRHSAREQRKAQQTYTRELADARRRAEEALAAETARRRDAHPDPASVLLTASLPTKRLWERRRLDPDADDPAGGHGRPARRRRRAEGPRVEPGRPRAAHRARGARRRPAARGGRAGPGRPGRAARRAAALAGAAARRPPPAARRVDHAAGTARCDALGLGAVAAARPTG
jgi:S-DNA-T family DNA segregation ATPase FtsK/SpoIIIE